MGKGAKDRDGKDAPEMGAGPALGESLSGLLHRAHQAAWEAVGAELAPHELTLRQFVVLATVGRAPGSSQTDLVHATGVDRSTLADIARKLEQRGLLRRAPGGDDKRERAVTITQAGAELVEAASLGVAAADRALLARLKRKRGADLMALLQDLAAAQPKAPKPKGKRKAKDKKAEAAAVAKPKAKKGARKRIARG